MKNYLIRKKTPAIVYAGSLIQQNHGEDISGHGYVIWNLKTKAFKQIDIDNDYGFYTIDIANGKLVTDVSNIPRKVRLRVRCFESVATEVKSIISELKKVCEIIETTYVRVESNASATAKKDDKSELNLSNLSSVEYQNKVIRDFISRKSVGTVVPESVLLRIDEMNKSYNESIDKEKSVRNIRWKPKLFTFSNMFSYGEDNVINFSNLKDVVGIFSVNMSGKSSILSALSFCIFDKCDRAFKASHILNSQKMSFTCKFNFDIDGTDFFIERTGKSDKKGNVKVEVKFWKEVDGKVIELNGEARRSTNDLIRDYLGSYEDFILTVLSIQNNKSGTFVDMGQSERKDLLSQFMGLNIFDELSKKSSDKLKELESQHSFLIKNQGEDINKIDSDIEGFSKKCEELVLNGTNLSSEKSDINKRIIGLTEGLVKLDEDLPMDISGVVEKNKKAKQQLKDKQSEIELVKRESESIKVEIDSVEAQLNLIPKTIEADSQELYNLKKLLYSKKNEIDKKKIVVDGKLEKIKRLELHKYDPNCKYCVNNDFVKDALIAKEELKSDKLVAAELLSEYSSINDKITEKSHVEELYEKFKSIPIKLSELEKKGASKSKKQVELNESVSTLSNNIKQFEELIERYLKQSKSIESNKVIIEERNKLSRQVELIEKRITENNSALTNFSTKVEVLKTNKLRVLDTEKKLKELETDIQAYSYYLAAVSRDGVPFELISAAVPLIEKEVNMILSQIVEFGVRIQTDGKNVITNIVYNEKCWPLELASGLEKFLTSLAIRVALINISNLPRPNFIAIDEGFGCADAENLASMSALFSILKTNFDFMLIISHLDSMKDMVDMTLEIKKENGFSKITA
jgi:DNA repair exonuclease SbcCD ATPase subunit